MVAWKEALMGGGSGAATGAMIGAAGGPASPITAPLGALVGGGLGLLGGLFAGNAREDAAAAQHRALDAAMGRLQQGAKQQYSDRMAAMDKVMGFYQPSQDVLKQLYGGQTWHPGAPPPAAGGQPPMPAPRPPQQQKGPPGFPAIGGGTPGMGRLGF